MFIMILRNVLEGRNKAREAKTVVLNGGTHSQRRLHQMMLEDCIETIVRDVGDPVKDHDCWHQAEMVDSNGGTHPERRLHQMILEDRNFERNSCSEYCIRHVDDSHAISEPERQTMVQCIEAAIERRVYEIEGRGKSVICEPVIKEAVVNKVALLLLPAACHCQTEICPRKRRLSVSHIVDLDLFKLEAEYVAAANCCGQHNLHSKEPSVSFQDKTHRDTPPFIRDCYEKKLISVEKIHTDFNVADLLTKPFDGAQFNYLVHVFLCFRLILAGIAWIYRCKAGVIRPLFWFAEIVDFLRGSNLRYALTSNPTIYDSFVKQFWQTATANTIADGTLEIHATIDTIGYTITETSIRDKLQLADATGITMLPNDEIFEGMGQMGYPTDGTFTFWKSFFTPQWRYLVHHLLYCISSKSGGWDQFGSNIATALICLSTDRVYNFSKLIFDGMVANLKSKTKFLMYPRFLQLILDIQTENKHPYLAVTLTKKIFGNMKRGFRGAPRPLLPAMLLVATTNPNAGQEHHAVAQSQPSSSTLPVPSTSSPPVQSPPPIPASIPTPTPIPASIPTPTPIPASIPTPTPIPETEPEPFEHTFEEPSPVHQHFSPLQEQAQG
ncbi:synaptobrevin, longin-like domain protein [Tanacetum coccineum]